MVGRKDKYGKPMGKPENPDNRDFTEKSTEAPLTEYEKRDRADKGFLPDGGGGYDASGVEIPEEVNNLDKVEGLRKVPVHTGNGDLEYRQRRVFSADERELVADGGYRDGGSGSVDSIPENPLYRDLDQRDVELMDKHADDSAKVDDSGENPVSDRSLRQEAMVLEEQGGKGTFLPPEVDL